MPITVDQAMADAGIRFAYLFGSRATGTATERVLQEGRLIYSSDEPARVAFEVRTRSVYFDYRNRRGQTRMARPYPRERSSVAIALGRLRAMGFFRTIIVVGLASFACVPYVTTGQIASAATPATIPAQARTTLLRDALKVAREDGDIHPYDIQAVSTTLGKGTPIECRGTCNGFERGQHVYVVAMRGHFGCSTCREKRGGRLLHGTEITLVYGAEVIDAKATRYMEFALGNTYPHLSAMGTSMRLRETPRPRRHH